MPKIKPQLLLLKTRDVPIPVQYAIIGARVEVMKAGSTLVVRAFQYANTNGEVIICSPYTRECLANVARGYAEYRRLPVDVRIVGLDVVVVRKRQ